MTLPAFQIGLLAFSATVALVFGLSPFAVAQTDPKATADEHFKRGVAMFQDRRFGDAATEFEEAYRLSPAYVVLYNIGQVNVALGRSVEAVDAYEKYLKQGASEISAERTREVQAEITKQRDRIGIVTVRTNPPGADIRIDGRWIGRSPLPHPVHATIGRHAFDAILSGFVPQVQEVDVIGRAEQALDITFAVDPAVTAKDTEAKVAEAKAEAAAARPGAAPTAAAAPVVTVVEIPRPEANVNVRPGASPDAEHAAAARSTVNWQRVVGYAVAIGGLGTATVGGLLAYDGANKMNDANARLAKEPTPMAYDTALTTYYNADYADGQHRNRLGWTIAGIGGAALIGGIIVIVTAPEKSASPNTNVSLTLSPIMTAAWNGLTLQGVY